MRRSAARAWRCYHRAMDVLLVLILVLVVVIIWRGPKTLPLLGKAFGQGVKEARKEIGELKSDATGGGGTDGDEPKSS
jgi:Sec-independent protein translocase protein TatA